MQEGELLGGRYRLQEVIGVGGMAEVWRARDEVLNRVVAVKLLAGPDMSDAAGRGIILAEAQAAALLSHPHITSVHDYGESLLDSGELVPFVVMELLSGPTLSERVAEEPIAPREAIRICAEVASALAAAHAYGLVHRDIKPANVVLTSAGAKVLDFGIAAFSGAAGLEPSGKLLGTPSYLAPERLTGDDVSPATDVYALGVLMYWLLAGSMPWTTASPSASLRARLTEEPRPFGSLPDVSDDVMQLCLRCLSRVPVGRPTADEVAGVLITALTHEPPAAPVRPTPPARPGRARRRTLVVSGALGIALVGLVAALQLTSGPDQGSPGGPAAAPDQIGPGSVDVPDVTVPAPGATGTSPGTRPGGPVSPGLPGGQPQPQPGGEATTPAGPTTTAPAPATSSSPPQPSGTYQVTARGGRIHVDCDAGRATVRSVQPAADYTVTESVLGPAIQVKVVLTSAERESEIMARCTGAGTMIPTVIETPPQ